MVSIYDEDYLAIQHFLKHGDPEICWEELSGKEQEYWRAKEKLDAMTEARSETNLYNLGLTKGDFL